MKTRLRAVTMIGVVLLFLPFFGVPSSLKAALCVALGVVLLYLSYSLAFAIKRLRFELRSQVVEPVAAQEHIHG